MIHVLPLNWEVDRFNVHTVCILYLHLLLLKSVKNMPVRKGTVDYEATTPTGAAILAACVNEFTDKADFSILKTGYGIGTKDSAIPNVLRVFLCETVSRPMKPETVRPLSSNAILMI